MLRPFKYVEFEYSEYFINPDLRVRLDPLLHVSLAGEVDVNDLGLDLVLLLQLLSHSPQLAQRPADQHNVLTTLGQFFTNAFSYIKKCVYLAKYEI